MPDRLIVGRRHVLQQAGEKVLGRQGLDLGPLSRPGLRMVGAPAKANTLLFALVLTFLHPALAQRGRFQVGELRRRALGVVQQPSRLERPAGHVPGLIAQHVDGGWAALLRRRGNKHHPFLPIDPVEPIPPAADGRACRQRQRSLVQQGAESLTDTRAKPHHEWGDRHQTAWTRHVRPLTLRAQSAAGHQTMQMGMHEESIVPGFQRHGDPRLRPQALRFRQQPAQGVDGAVEEQVSHDPWIQAPEGIERVREGEDHVNMAHRQQRLELSEQPTAAKAPGAARTEAMPAGIVEHAFDVPVWTALHMPAQRGRLAVQRHPDRPAHVLLQCVAPFEGRIMGVEEVDQAIRRGGHDVGARDRAAGEAIDGV